MTVLNENTKINIGSAVYVLGFVIAVVAGHFYTLAEIKKSVADVETRVSVLEKSQANFETYLEKSQVNFETYRQETNDRLDDIDGNQVKLMVALGVPPDPLKEKE